MLEDGEALKDLVLTSISGVLDGKNSTNVDVILCKILKNAFFCLLEILLQFVLDHIGILRIPDFI